MLILFRNLFRKLDKLNKVYKQTTKGIIMRNTNNNGYTILELVIAAGIILLLVAGGFAGYGELQRNSQEKTTRLAAELVMVTAINYDRDYDEYTNPEMAAEEATENSRGASADITFTASVSNQTEPRCITVVATHADGFQVTYSEATTIHAGSSACAETNEEVWL